MATLPYFARYTTFKTADKESGGYLLSADSLIGDVLSISFEVIDGRQVAILVNRFGHNVGKLDRSDTHELLLRQADGWEIHAILSAVLFSEGEGNGYYWGEVALMAFSKRHSREFNTFMQGICAELRKGRRPSIALKSSGVETVISTNGKWVPKDREPKRSLKAGTVVVKDHLKYDERLVEMARNKNIGCMIIGWAFIFLLVALVGVALWSIIPS